LSFWLRWFSVSHGDEEEKEGKKRAAAEQRKKARVCAGSIGLGLKEGESEERLTRLAWLLQERKRSTPPACFPVKNTTTKWPEVVMSFGGGWFGLGPKKGGVVPFRIYSRRFQKLHRDNDRDREGFCKHF
jgi:hypothetical protein